ncbi:MAG: s-methyl-5-thioribose-1-phosphate isomerase [Oscillospiraceae bacterium]|nr:s-methyl-5-thioribose-1-phosphate isomerase [Oscillospiraceae bacterium]
MAELYEQIGFVENFKNVAWYEDGKVSILDRRVYPYRVEFVVCEKHEEIADAIKNMVTQSGGPYVAAMMGMALAADEAKDLPEDEYKEYIEKAAYTLSHARPTTVGHMTEVTKLCKDFIFESLEAGKSRAEIPDLVREFTVEKEKRDLNKHMIQGKYVADKIPKGGTFMTQCYAGAMVAGILHALREQGKDDVKVICPETRPYLQGARLTSSLVKQMGFDVTVVTDNMPGYTIKAKNVDLFTAAADVLTLDGYVVNKIGTFQIALACKYWEIPFICTAAPNKNHPTIDTVKIELRNELEVLSHLGIKATLDGVKGYYPAFDITPPKYVDMIATDKGLFSPYDLAAYFNK